MIKKEELYYLYNWAKNKDFPIRSGPTSSGYSNKPVKFCWIKKNMKSCLLRKSVIDNYTVETIHKNEDILFSMYVVFDGGTELGPHKDPNIYKEEYKRIQIPITIPSKDECYMMWKGEKVFYQEGVYQIYDVMDHVHSGYNYSNDPMAFLFVDVKKGTEVEIQ
jgi:hypothetical protein